MINISILNILNYRFKNFNFRKFIKNYIFLNIYNKKLLINMRNCISRHYLNNQIDM